MSRFDMASFNSIRATLVGLIIECQLGGNPEDCPLYEERALSFSERVKWIKSLSDDELCRIYLAHSDCLDAKLAANASS